MTPPELPHREIGFHTRPEDKGPAAKRRKIREQMNSPAMIHALYKGLATKAEGKK